MPDQTSFVGPQQTGSNLEAAPTGSGINTPGFEPGSSKPKRRAISDIHHVNQIVAHLQDARKSQNEKNKRIADKLNSERPYSDDKLESEGLGYKSNVSTKPLSTTVGKVASRLVKAVQSARFLTAAALPDSVPGAKEKTELARGEITNLVRRWDGWFDSLTQLATEDAVFGWAAVAWLDDRDWKFRVFRQDEAYFPDGTGHSVDTVQVCALRRLVYPHELAAYIEDREAAKLAGWEVDNVVEAINSAKPVSTGAAGSSAEFTDARRYADAMRESSVSASLVNGAKQVEIYDLLATEIDGKVSHYITDWTSKKLLFVKEDRYERMADCLALVSYEHGTGKLMGSKGIGREIYELANAVDRARNEAIDRLQMSGKLIVTGPESAISRFKLNVLGNVALIPDGFNLQQNKIDSSVKDFIELDNLLQNLLDRIAGSVSPRQFDRERVTKTEVDLIAAREEEQRDDRDTRFIMQVAKIVSTIQRRAITADQSDQDAKDVREKLLASFASDELESWVKTPALRTIEDWTELDAQKVIMFANEKRSDPIYNQYKLQKRAASAWINPEFAEDVILPENDPTEENEQRRLQLLEGLILGLSEPVPISPRDNHLIHIAVLKEKLAPAAQAAGSGDQQALSALNEAMLTHWSEHVAAAEAQGVDKSIVNQLKAEIKALAKQVGEMQAQIQSQLQEQQTMAGGMPGASALPGTLPEGGAPAAAVPQGLPS